MTRAQWVILSRLERQPGLSQIEIAALVELEPISVARLVDKLQDNGLVERRPDPKDRRVWRLHLTAVAKPMLKIIRKHRGELKDEVTEGLDAKALDAAIDSLLIMKANLSNGRSSLRTG
jgi:DNA-binding MarR family transcriptional regulator